MTLLCDFCPRPHGELQMLIMGGGGRTICDACTERHIDMVERLRPMGVRFVRELTDASGKSLIEDRKSVV